MNKISKNRIKAFTLAEVLVTLMVIGVVAALTIPSLIQSYQDNSNRVAFKKIYSSINQATLMIMSDNGGTMKGLTIDGHNFAKLYEDQFRIIKSCPAASLPGNCWHNANDWYYLNGNAVGESNAVGFITTNGSFFYIQRLTPTPDCGNAAYVYPACALITVDVNGWKIPNTVGKDIFKVYVTENGIKPFGLPNTHEMLEMCVVGSTLANNLGLGCSYKILNNEDY
ncbi:MAG: hypothetical protein A2104_00195 [Candidatus Melainabacteria bacterium GWF2_32_7]|nr:MAG: hypothetical protein A2104_00195 [Candidatus Melainabacteria bacterium GWF2_32_7]